MNKKFFNELKDLANRWDERASNWDNNLKDPTHYTNFEQSYLRTDKFITKYIEIFLKENSILTPAILDIGCGTGESTRNLLKYSNKVVGIDISKNMIDIANEKKLPINFIYGDIFKNTFPDKSFDIIVTRGIVLSHIPLGLQPILIKEVKRISKKKSLIVLDYLHDLKAKEEFTKFSAPKASYDKITITSEIEKQNLKGKYYFGGEKTERVNRIAIFRF